MRLQQGTDYVGYLAIVGAEALAPDDTALQRGFSATKGYMSDYIKQRTVKKVLSSLEFNRRLESAKQAVLGALGDPKHRNLGLRFVADMLTAHIGAGWNRAACYCPVGKNVLMCLWAQGGDGSERWSERVQRPIGEKVHSVEELVKLVGEEKTPTDDHYNGAALCNPGLYLHLDREPDNRSTPARLWQNRGNVKALPQGCWEWELTDVPASHVGLVDREPLGWGGALAAKFGHDDPWVERVANERPAHPLFASKNELYWALPWFLGDEPIAIWIVDMAYWGTVPEDRAGIPSLVMSDQILRRLGPPCHALRKDNWNGGRF
jgi:hypothetical protein